MSISTQKTVTAVADLVEYYQNINTEEKLYTGIELERSGVYRDTLLPVQYNDATGYSAVFHKLIEEVGWEAIEQDQDMMYELQRGDTRITTEADGRPELTGSPKENLHDLAREYRLHDNELKEMGDIFHIAWLPLGLQPFATNKELHMVPKKRYEIFMEVDDSDWMHTWLKRFNGIHINISYTNEQNAIRKAQTAFRIMPMISAMYASSPFMEGKPTGMLNTRRSIVKSSKLGSQGIPSTFLEQDFSYKDWIESIIDIPVIYAKNAAGEPELPSPTCTFRQWMKQGLNGNFPTIEDFDQHVKTIWSDVRLRPSYIEQRVADSVPYPLAMSLAALMKGLMMDSSNWDAIAELTKNWTYQDVINADAAAWKTGLQTEVKGRKLLTYAQEIIILANAKLHMFNRKDATDEDESVYLAPLKEQIFIKEKSPAEELLALYEGEWNNDVHRIVEWCDQSA